METRARTFQGPGAAAGPDSEGPVSFSPGALCLPWLQYSTGIKVLAVGGGGIRVLLYGIAGGWYSELGVRLTGVVAC